MNVLVVGGAGYIGSHCVRQALAAGHKVAVLDDLSYGHAESVPAGVKLFRADHLASRDAGALSHEIDGAATQLDRTRDWLSSLEFDTSPSDIPEELAAAAPLKVGQ